jgi:hypothetical protein
MSPLAGATLRAKKWMEAGAILAVDKTAIVRCPERDDGILVVRDQLSADGREIAERFIVCNPCARRAAFG